jgi:hypothetical protein
VAASIAGLSGRSASSVAAEPGTGVLLGAAGLAEEPSSPEGAVEGVGDAGLLLSAEGLLASPALVPLLLVSVDWA